MASKLPRDWNLNTFQVGPTLATITVKAGTGRVSHILTSIVARYENFDGTLAQSRVVVWDGPALTSPVLYQRPVTCALSGAGAGADVTTDDFTDDVWLLGSPNTIMTIAFLAIGGNANYQQFLEVTGHSQ